MKKIFYLLVTVAILASCQNTQDSQHQPAPTQEIPGPPQSGPNAPQPAPEMSREERMEQIKMQKIAYMTDELKLTVEESQAFWPVYNQWWEESMALTHEQYSSFKDINKSDNATMADLETIAASYEKQAQLVRKWGKEFAKVIPESKVAKVFVSEERFKSYLIRKGPQWGGKPQK